MYYSEIKNTKIVISKIGFGCSNFGGIGSDPNSVGKGDTEEEAHRMLDSVYSSGINYFDTATTYGGGNSEKILGSWIRKNNIERSKIVVSSKVNKRVGRFRLSKKGLPRKHIISQVEKSLERLKLSYLDVFYIHSPDLYTPITEVLEALNECVKNRLVVAIGISNVSKDYLMESLDISNKNGWARYSVVQNSYNYLERNDEQDVIPFCRENEILYVGYGPLAGGILSGKYQMNGLFPVNSRLFYRKNIYESYLNDAVFKKLEELKCIAKKRNVSLPMLMYSWLYNNKCLDSFLIGTRNKKQFQPILDILSLKGDGQDLPLVEMW